MDSCSAGTEAEAAQLPLVLLVVVGNGLAFPVNAIQSERQKLNARQLNENDNRPRAIRVAMEMKVIWPRFAPTSG